MEEIYNKSNMEVKNVKQLRSIARELGVRGYSRVKKKELEQLISDYQYGRAALHKRTKKELKSIAKEAKISRYSKLNKQELNDAVKYYIRGSPSLP